MMIHPGKPQIRKRQPPQLPYGVIGRHRAIVHVRHQLAKKGFIHLNTPPFPTVLATYSQRP